LVAYDDVGGQFAARLWWLCRWVGLRNVALLDGGVQHWKASGYALESAIPQARPAPLSGHADALMLTSVDELLPRINRPGLTIIDARAPERYRGDVEPIDPVAGHIPGAVNRFYKENLNADLTMKAPEALRDAFANFVEGGSEVVHQCGSGVTACANIFAMEYAGLTGSRLYAGSWSEWIADPSRPMVVGPASKTKGT
jgi:thiosulfate/3-mercaptopyruvate sulfurtransferase